jgi:hypothetical protein
MHIKKKIWSRRPNKQTLKYEFLIIKPPKLIPHFTLSPTLSQSVPGGPATAVPGVERGTIECEPVGDAFLAAIGKVSFGLRLISPSLASRVPEKKKKKKKKVTDDRHHTTTHSTPQFSAATRPGR